MSLSTSQQRYRYLTHRNKPIIIGKTTLCLLQQQYYFKPQMILYFYIIGYDHNAKSGKAERAIKTDGANVIIWSFLHLHEDVDTKKIRTALDLTEIRNIRDKYEHIM